MLSVLTYADVAATGAGIDQNLALSLVAIANGCSFFGRISSGYLSQRIGPFNVLVPWTVIAGIMTCAWPYATNRSATATIVVVALYGIASGAFVGIITVPLSHPSFGEQWDLGRRTGMILTLCAIGALSGPPISGAIHTASGGYKLVGWYAGTRYCKVFYRLSREQVLTRVCHIRIIDPAILYLFGPRTSCCHR